MSMGKGETYQWNLKRNFPDNTEICKIYDSEGNLRKTVEPHPLLKRPKLKGWKPRKGNPRGD